MQGGKNTNIKCMGKYSKIIILVLIVSAFGAGIYFKDDAIKFYNSASWQINKQIQDFQQTDIGSVVAEAGREIFNPSPLKIGGESNNVVLLKSKIIEQTNLQRAENNLPALTENQYLSLVASAKAQDMFKNQYFEHVSPSGQAPGDLVKSFGYGYIATGENLILGNFKNEREVVSNWMASPGHRANILNNRYTEIGVSIIKGTYEGETVWIGVQEFGLPLSACSQPNESLKINIDYNQTELANLSLQIDAKKEEINSANSKSAPYSQMIDDYNQLVENYNFLAEQTKRLISNYNNQVNNFNQCVAGK